MLRFFKNNAFFQIFSLLLLLLLTRLPVFLNKVPLLIPELKWQLVGEQIVNGNLLYVDILDNIGPLSAYIYAGIHFFFGRSIVAFHIIALLITAFQMYYFTLLAHKKGLFFDRNYVPGLIFILFFTLSVDFYTLSPALMGTSFLLLAYGGFIGQIEKLGATDEVFEIGIYIGIGFLFYPPIFLFFIWVLISLNMYTGAKLRQQFLVIFGFLLPFAIAAIWYFIGGHFNDFYQNFIISVFQKRQFSLNNINNVLLIFSIPLLISVLGFFIAIGTSRYSNFQTRAQQLILLWFLFGIFSMLLMPYFAPMQFIPLILPLAYFSNIFFANFKKKLWIVELFFLLVFSSILYLNYQSFLPRLDNKILSDLESLKVTQPINNTEIKNKKVFVMGNDLSPYLKNKSATPYVNWALAKNEFLNLDNYSNVIDILNNFQKDPPEYIFDQENLVPKLFSRIPALNNKYKKVKEGLYEIK